VNTSTDELNTQSTIQQAQLGPIQNTNA